MDRRRLVPLILVVLAAVFAGGFLLRPRPEPVDSTPLPAALPSSDGAPVPIETAASGEPSPRVGAPASGPSDAEKAELARNPRIQQLIDLWTSEGDDVMTGDEPGPIRPAPYAYLQESCEAVRALPSGPLLFYVGADGRVFHIAHGIDRRRLEIPSEIFECDFENDQAPGHSFRMATLKQ
jgi:hypothetical protein